MSFCYNVDEMPQEFNSRLYQLACGKLFLLYIISLQVAEPIDDIEDSLLWAIKYY